MSNNFTNQTRHRNTGKGWVGVVAPKTESFEAWTPGCELPVQQPQRLITLMWTGLKKIHNQKQNKNLSQNFKTSKGQLGGNVNSSADACSSAGNIEIFTHICVRRSWTAAAPPASMTSGSHADTFQWEFSKDSPSSSPSLQEEWQHLEISWGDATKWPCGSAVDQLESRTCLSVPSSEPAPCF